MVQAETTRKQWPSAVQQSNWLRENANALRECANTDFCYGRTESAARLRKQANELLWFGGFIGKFPAGTTVTGFYSQGSFRFRVPAPAGVLA
jgi:hypothetical protein